MGLKVYQETYIKVIWYNLKCLSSLKIEKIYCSMHFLYLEHIFNCFGKNNKIMIYFKPSQISRDELKLPIFQHVIEHLMAENIIAKRFSAVG